MYLAGGKLSKLYNQYTLKTAPAMYEVLIALLAEAGFDSFEETQESLLAFATADRHAEWEAALSGLSDRFSFTYDATALPEKNWNEEWESRFPPLYVEDRLFIRAEFHEPDPGAELELVITPKMAFGTGHHATTYMMCELLLGEELEGRAVLDYGSGTGVLAILAARLGATHVDAVEVEAAAVENTRENAERNAVRINQIVHGTLGDLQSSKRYDLILANINRNVLLASAGALYARVNTGGSVFCSGILAADEQRLQDHLVATGFSHRQTLARDDWRAFVFTKN